MSDPLDDCTREVGHLHLLLAAANEEIDLIRDRVDLIVAARVEHLHRTIRDQAGLIDDRDRYIRELEAALDQARSGQADLVAELERRHAELQELRTLSGASRTVAGQLRSRLRP